MSPKEMKEKRNKLAKLDRRKVVFCRRGAALHLPAAGFALLGVLFSITFLLGSSIWGFYYLMTAGLAIFAVVGLIFSTVGTRAARRAFKLKQEINFAEGKDYSAFHGYDNIVDLISVTAVKFSGSLLLVVAALGVLGYSHPRADPDPWGPWALPLLLLLSGLLMLTTRPLNYSASSSGSSGYLDLFQPSLRPAYLDYLFTDLAMAFMDPELENMFDEYTADLKGALNGEVSVEVAREKLLYLSYLELNGVIKRTDLISEMGEVLKPDSVGIVERHPAFSANVFIQILQRARDQSPQFFRIVDRLQFDLMDNLGVFTKTEVYFDCDVEQAVVSGQANLFIFLLNNTDEEKQLRIRILTSDFEPGETRLSARLPAIGEHSIEAEDLELLSDGDEDVVGYISQYLDLGDTAWVSLSAKHPVGSATLNVFVEDEEGTLLVARSLKTKVVKPGLFDAVFDKMRSK